MLGLVVAAVACLSALAPSQAAAFSKAIWGPAYRNGVNQFPLYHKLGVKIYEDDLVWSQVAPTRPRHATDPRDPAYRWPRSLSVEMNQAARFHMRVMLQIIFTPSWANGGRSQIWAPDRFTDFAAFAMAAARRYPSVHLWMIWGEPDNARNFQPLTPTRSRFPGQPLSPAQLAAPHRYAQLLDSAYGALKAVNRANQVIGGSSWSFGDVATDDWVNNLVLPNGHRPRMDMYAHNPFTERDPNFSNPQSGDGGYDFSDLQRLSHLITQDFGHRLPLFLSEWSIPTQRDPEFSFWVDPNVAAQWITDALRLSRQWVGIYALGWIHVYDSPPDSYGGLLQADGRPKPSFYAFSH